MSQPLTPPEVADRIAIDDLLTRYAHAIDSGDWDLLDTVYTPDATLDYTAAGGIRGGRDEVKAWLASVLPLFPMRQHVITNKTVVLDGDAATVRAYFYNPMQFESAERTQFHIMGGYYNHRLVRTPEGWRSVELVEEHAYDVVVSDVPKPKND